MQMLVVEDDDVLADGLTRVFSGDGCTVKHVESAEEADALLSSGHPYRCVLLDLGLPGMDGTELIKLLRNRGDLVPILVLTARNSQEELVEGLDSGADDYLTKPFTLKELEARVKSVLRRAALDSGKTAVSREIRLDTDRFLYVRDRTIRLSPSEFALFRLLFERSGSAVRKDECNAVLERESLASGNSVLEVYFHRLRKKLLPYGIVIKTIRGVGYLMEPTE
jgi:two-component system OmpR family response regulator